MRREIGELKALGLQVLVERQRAALAEQEAARVKHDAAQALVLGRLASLLSMDEADLLSQPFRVGPTWIDLPNIEKPEKGKP